MPFNWLIENPLFFLAWVAAILVALTIHEFSHAAAAKYFGDSTAEAMGRLTLNPLVHIDPLGFIMLLFVGFGWARPVPINLNNLRNQRVAQAVVSISGPAANLIGIVVFGFLHKILIPYLGGANLLTNFLFMAVLVNAILMLFNLIPIPPLDGSKVLFSLLPDKFEEFKYKLSVNGPWILLGLILADSFLNIGIFSFLFRGILTVLKRIIS